MLKAVLQGIGLGLIITTFVGPVFFALLQTSIKKGFFAGSLLAVGIMLSDAFFILISYLGISRLLVDSEYSRVIGVAGGVVLILFGLVSFFKKVKLHELRLKAETPRIKLISWPAFVLKGFVLNATNPSILVFWIGVVAFVTARPGFHTEHLAVFFTASLATVLTTDMTKSFVAQKLKRWMTPRLLFWTNRLLGIILMGFGMALIVKVLWDNQLMPVS